MWRELIQSQKDLLLPELVAEQCVHTQVEMASCQACVDACPRKAWIIDDEMLGIDPDLCDGCELCVVACPQGAMHSHYATAIRQSGQLSTAFAHCEYAGIDGVREGLMPCIHTMEMRQLLHLQRAGVSHLITCSSHCDECPRGSAHRLEDRINDINTLLISRGAKPIKHRSFTKHQWIKAWHTLAQDNQKPKLSRRAFFQQAAQAPAERIKTVLQEQTSFQPPATLLPESESVTRLYPHVPKIDTNLCSGCDACIRLCPNQALTLDKEGSAYMIDAGRCTGCSICSDICDRHAIKIQAMSANAKERIPLHNGNCPACGVKFHIPEKGTAALCPICVKINHRANLYQVLA
jgi:ferredoxin